MVTRSLDKASVTAPLPCIAEEKAPCFQGGDNKVVEPKIVTVNEEGGTRLLAKKTPSQLPYLNRNPAV